MLTEVQNLLSEVEAFYTDNKDQLEAFRIRFLGKKGIIPKLFDDFKNIPTEQKREMGKILNELKTAAAEKVEKLKQKIEQKQIEQKTELDLTLPTNAIALGSRHPVSIIKNQINEIFSRIGFTVAEGPEIEDDWHNFTALNFPPDHPSRDMQDTFFVSKNPDIALRTHTSSVQVRVMEKQKPPIKVIIPGRAYRNESISARAHCFFHQVEGLYIDYNVSFADLKQTLCYFAKEMFGADTQIRLRPSFFPFTEPSAEMDISCFICGQKGCGICKRSGWVEILGCGMVDPNVLDNCKIDSKIFTGFAFGMGIERIAMLKYRINDIRLFSQNDIRFLKQFEGTI